MNRDENDKLIKQELKKILIAMHNGESLLITLGKIMETLKGVRYVEERKFIYLLQGLHLSKLEGIAAATENPEKIEGFNEAAEENNFAVKLAISAIMGEE